MPPIRLLKRVDAGGRIEITGLPFQEGQQVEVTIAPTDYSADEMLRYPLRHAEPYRFEDALSPVGVEDWEVLRDSA
ncbi:hypothetical protein HRbin16_01677 [bacterium HR16]|nr:hypothetical protein HRbin16_01677 [bacterium HR16]